MQTGSEKVAQCLVWEESFYMALTWVEHFPSGIVGTLILIRSYPFQSYPHVFL